MKDVLKYKDCIATIHFSSEDDIFYGKIAGIDDLISFEGSSVEELKDAFREAVEDYLELCKQTGKPAQKSYKGTFNVRIQPMLHKQAVFKSVELGVSLNQYVEQAIQEKLSKEV